MGAMTCRSLAAKVYCILYDQTKLLLPFCDTYLSCAAPQIFITLGMAQKASLLGILIVSAVNLVATAIAIYAVDRQVRSLLLGSQADYNRDCQASTEDQWVCLVLTTPLFHHKNCSVSTLEPPSTAALAASIILCNLGNLAPCERTRLQPSLHAMHGDARLSC